MKTSAVPSTNCRMHHGIFEETGFTDSFLIQRGPVFVPSRKNLQSFTKVFGDYYPHSHSVTAGRLQALLLIEQILRYVYSQYIVLKSPDLRSLQAQELSLHFSKNELSTAASSYNSLFRQLTDAALQNEAQDASLMQEEFFFLFLARKNPAFKPFRSFYTVTELLNGTEYANLLTHFTRFFAKKPVFGPENQIILDFLQNPMNAAPHDLLGQLKYIYDNWKEWIEPFLSFLLTTLDILKEESKYFLPGPGITPVPSFGSGLLEEENFTDDKDWMPRVILIAKSTYVWLDQLSKKYSRPIYRLDQIPDQELDILHDRGFTGLWLIGLWERSPASKRMKQICGNPEAEASAYSLRNYEISGDLGGWEALGSLRERCMSRGIRLAADMVPNHTGLDSDWMVNHPEWFLQLPYSPYPNYSFNGENYSPVPGKGVYIEDHYYSRQDAAVVFKYVDFMSNQTRYIYHGNDGTSMPWNDTAQINFLDAQAREAVIDNILHVAKNFPIIRFDAAMTLAKKHIQRLWFPLPGQGGDIPSRAGQGMDQGTFDSLIPKEFWREVVDRAKTEAPETLLLAEAFWMMEGYFVRTLGMHRVYNSAFMNMLKKEDNANYRLTIRNTIEFDPEILKRYVNFMNNPDEDTAIAQFGDSDKYFGVCTMMATMPGLPMFGHGQVEGFTEKYGMEYRRAYRDEHPNDSLIRRHDHEIFPLLRLRALFSHVAEFLFYDCWAPEGWVNENVFAYTNRYAGRNVLVFYNNSMGGARGTIRMSCAYVKKTSTSDKNLVQRSLAEGLRLSRGQDKFCMLCEQRSGLTFIRPSDQIWDKGLYLELNGYQSQVFTDVYEVADTSDGVYAQLCRQLSGGGTSDVLAAIRQIRLSPLYNELEKICSALQESKDSLITGREEGFSDTIVEGFFSLAASYLNHATQTSKILTHWKAWIKKIAQLTGPGSKKILPAGFVKRGFQTIPYINEILLVHCLTDSITGAYQGKDELDIKNKIREWGLPGVIAKFTGLPAGTEEQFQRLAAALAEYPGTIFQEIKTNLQLIDFCLSSMPLREFLGVNLYQDTEWFNREGFLELIWWFGFFKALTADPAELPAILAKTDRLVKACDFSGYKIEKLVEYLTEHP